MEGLRPAFAGRIGLMAYSGGTLRKAESLGPGRAGLPAVGAEGNWGGADVLHNRCPAGMQSECHGPETRPVPATFLEAENRARVRGQERALRLRHDVMVSEPADDGESREDPKVAIHSEVPPEDGLVPVAEVRDLRRR